MTLETEYNGHVIVYIERDNVWRAYPIGAEHLRENQISESMSLANCKANVDSRQHRLAKEKFKPIKAFLYENFSRKEKFRPCTVTSKEALTDQQNRRGFEAQYFVTITETKGREKVSADRIILDTEENRNFIAKYIDGDARIEIIYEENKQLLEQMEKME